MKFTSINCFDKPTAKKSGNDAQQPEKNTQASCEKIIWRKGGYINEKVYCCNSDHAEIKPNEFLPVNAFVQDHFPIEK